MWGLKTWDEISSTSIVLVPLSIPKKSYILCKCILPQFVNTCNIFFGTRIKEEEREPCHLLYCPCDSCVGHPLTVISKEGYINHLREGIGSDASDHNIWSGNFQLVLIFFSAGPLFLLVGPLFVSVGPLFVSVSPLFLSVGPLSLSVGPLFLSVGTHITKQSPTETKQ